MAFSTFVLNVRERDFGSTKPTFVHVKVYPLATASGALLKVVKDTTGNVVLSGHADVKADASQIAAGLLVITLPDSRDTTLNPTGFGYRVDVQTNYFSRSVTFGPTELIAYAVGGVLELEDVTDAEGVAFEAAYLERLDTLLALVISVGIDTDGTPYFDPGNIPIGSAATVQADTDGVPYFAIGA